MEDVKENVVVDEVEPTDGEPSTPQVEEETKIPYSRFKEVNDQLKAVKQEIDSLKTTKSSAGLTPEQEKELQAKTYLKGLLSEVLTEQETNKKSAEEAQQRQFNEKVNDVIELNPDVKKADFLKFIENEAENYGISSVDGAMKLYRKMNNLSKEVEEKTKQDILNKPKMPKHEGGGSTGVKVDDSNKSFNQIIAEVINEASKVVKK